jgi:MarR family 2-MHQ and catechol resistance regulon transcriptional repressor
LQTFIDRLQLLSPKLMKAFYFQDHDQSLVTLSELWALDCLVRDGSMTMKELSSAVQLKTSSTTSLVDRLIARGYAKRVRCKEDKRVVWVQVTAKGQKGWKKIQDHKRDGMVKLFESLTEDERSQYLKIIEKVVHNLEESSK